MSETQLSFKDYINMVRKRKWLAAMFFIVVVSSTTLYSLLHPKIYHAATTILIERSGKKILSFDEIFPIQTSGIDYYPTQYRILKSRVIGKRVMDALGLWSQYSWAKDPIGAFLGQITIDPIKQSRLVNVGALSESPEQARDIANAIVKFFIEQNLDSKMQMSQQASQWIQSKIGDVQETLNRAELELEVVALKQESLVLNEQYLTKHPKVLRTRERIDQLEKHLGHVVGTYDSGELAVLHNQLTREVESVRKIHETMLNRLKETSIAEGMEDTNVVVIDKAELPDRPVAPRVLLNIVLSVLVGFVGGVGLCVLFESLDNTVKSHQDIGRYVGLPVLGVVSRWNVKKQEIIVHEKWHSPEAEFFRAIRTSLLFSSPDNPLRTLLVTSPQVGDGKTLVAVNLAATIAQTGARVLIVDADMRKPRVHLLFGAKNEVGLTSLFTQVQPENSASVILKTPIKNLSALFCGPLPPLPSELLGSQKMRSLVNKFRDEYDFVIFDSPPVMVVTDAVVLGSFLDGVILVTRYAKTPKEIIAPAWQRLMEVQAKTIGIILNGFDSKREHYQYPVYSYYGHKEPADKQSTVPQIAGAP